MTTDSELAAKEAAQRQRAAAHRAKADENAYDKASYDYHMDQARQAETAANAYAAARRK